jgi:hypothetical protein
MPAAHKFSPPSVNAIGLTFSRRAAVITLHSARITGLVTFLARDGQRRRIPEGPCLLEERSDAVVEIIWGANGQNCTRLERDYVEKAKECGRVVLLN